MPGRYIKKGYKQVGLRSQAAMEYLMTYGWAILTITIVLGALYQLGVFNPAIFAPKNTCQVLRPNGPYSTSFIRFVGTCNDQLPQYVGLGGTGWVSIQSPVINGLSEYTISAWVFPTNAFWGCIFGVGQELSPVYWISSQGRDSQGNIDNSIFISSLSPSQKQISTGVKIPINSWHMLTVTLTGGGDGTGTWDVYLDSVSEGEFGGTWLSTSAPMSAIGGCYTNSAPRQASFTGLWGNVQVYNASLSQSDIQTLYAKGIGGAPIRIQNLVGWWPVNGDFNDYSGNSNNGAPNYQTIASYWTSNYMH